MYNVKERDHIDCVVQRKYKVKRLHISILQPKNIFTHYKTYVKDHGDVINFFNFFVESLEINNVS